MLLHYWLLKIASLRPSSAVTSDLGNAIDSRWLVHAHFSSWSHLSNCLFSGLFAEPNMWPCTGIIRDGIYEQAPQKKTMEMCSPFTSQKSSLPRGPKHSPELSQPFQRVSSRFPKPFAALGNYSLSLHYQFISEATMAPSLFTVAQYWIRG